MPAQVIDGRALAKKLRESIAEEVAEIRKQSDCAPGLGVILVGDNPASETYVRMKGKACDQVGIDFRLIRMPDDAPQAQLLEMVEVLNRDEDIHGILVQLPLPEHMDEELVCRTIDPRKDVDGFHPDNVASLFIRGDAPFIPCTPLGIIEMIKSTGTTLQGAEAVVVGRSNIVGKPMALLLLREHCTVTICHSRTRDLGEVCRRADILIAAAGRPRLITGEMVKRGAVVIDVGINRLDDGSLVGDVDFDSASQVAGWISPVPGGVGPMTITMLLHNVVRACKEQLAK